MAENLVSRIIVLGVSALQLFQPRRQVDFGRLQQQVIMVVHHHPGMDAPTGLLTRFAQRCQPQLAVALVGIDVPPLVAARHHMVSGPGLLDAYLACDRRSSWTQSRR